MTRAARRAEPDSDAANARAAQLRGLSEDGAAIVAIAGVEAHCDPYGGLWLPDWDALVVSDLHFEKASHFAEAGYLVPPYDTARTLDALEAMAARYRPGTIVSLGDAFHDPRGPSRMMLPDRARLDALQVGRDWVWVTGNHDPGPLEGADGAPLEGESVDVLELGPLRLVHEPAPAPAPGEIAGHLHPVARLASPRRSGGSGRSGRARAVRRPCFACDGERMVMPAIGAFTGGLSVRAAPFRGLFDRGRLIAHMLGADRVYSVPGSSLS